MKNFTPMQAVVLLGVITGACGRNASGPNPLASDASDDSALVPYTRPAVTPSAVSWTPSAATRLADAKRKSLAWTVNFQGAGPLRPGMSLAHAVVLMEGDFWTHDASANCMYFQAARAPGMKFVFLHRNLARIEVDSGAVATTQGIRIGASEEQVQAAYPGHVTITDDAHSGAHYLSARAPDEADSAFRIVFETNGKRVTRLRMGVRQAVEWIEGCS